MITASPSIGTTLGNLISTVKNLIPVVGPMISNTTTKIAELAKTYLPTVAKFVEAFAQGMQILLENETVDDIGRKAKLSDKSPEDFDSIHDYIDHLRSQVKPDAEKIETETDIDKYINLAIGTALMIKTINETKETTIPVETWISLAKLGLETTEAEALLDSFKETYDQLNAYLNGQHTPEQEIATGDKLTEVYKELYPELSDAEIESKVMQLELSEDKK